MSIRYVLQLAAFAALAMVTVPTASSAQSYPYQYGQDSPDYVTGYIGTSRPYNIWLGNNSLHVTLRDGTVINPTGTTLQSGMRVRVWGQWTEDGTFEANRIDIVPGNGPISRTNPYNAYGSGAYGPSSTYGPSRYAPYTEGPGYMFGAVASFQPYNLWLGRGNGSLHVTLHDGTVINPTGVTLQPDMRVRVYGHWNGNGTYEADRIDVLNADAFGY